MKKYITNDLIVDETRMLTTDYKCSCIYVEGDSDKRFYELMLNDNRVYFRELEGWEKVVETVRCANDRKAKGIMGFIDRDYHELLRDGILDVQNILHTDENDLELMLVFSEAFDKFIALSASNEKVVSIRQCRDLIVFAAAQFGALRYVSARDALYLSFDGLKLKDFIDKSSLSVDLRKLVEKVRSRSCSKGRSIDVTVDQLVSKMNDVLREYQPNLLCNGHDTLEVLSLSLAKRFATYDMSDYPEERLFESLAMGYSREMFVKSNLYRCYKEHIQ